MASALYDRVTTWAEANDRDGGELHRAVWGPVPWMLDVHIGRESVGDRRWDEILDWCRDRWGKAHWPIDGEAPGRWRSGNAVVNGWQWFGFATREMMEEFQARWGGTATVHDGRDIAIGSV